MKQLNKHFLFLIMLLPLTCVLAQHGNVSQLEIRNIMNGEKFTGYSPDDIRWSDDNETIYFEWNPDMEVIPVLYKYDLASGSVSKVSIEEQKQLDSRWGVVYNKSRTKKLVASSGTFILKDLKRGTEKTLIAISDRLSPTSFSKDESKVFFEYNDNLYSLTLANGKIEQLTNFGGKGYGRDGKEDKSEQDTWLEAQQLDLFQVLNDKKAVNEARKEQRKALEKKIDGPKPINTNGKQVRGIEISPNEDFITYSLASFGGMSGGTKIMNYLTESGYAEAEDARAKVGTPFGTSTIGFYNVKTGESYELNVDSLPGITDFPDYYNDYPEKFGEAEPFVRDVNIAGPVWSEDGKYAVAVVRSVDNKDRWIVKIDLETGLPELLDRQRDEAWIAGPGIGSWNYGTGSMGWMPDNKRIWFQSEESGYSHLYTVNVDTGEKKALTSGDYEVYDPRISADKKYWYFAANKKHPGIREYFKMPLEGGNLEKLVSLTDGHVEATLSPDEKYIAIRYSSTNKPWELYIQKNKAGQPAKQLTDSQTDEFKSYDWREPEVVSFKADDGVEVFARLYQPEGEKKNGAAVIFVHGAGYLQNAHYWWSNYFREYMFHNILADNGYTVLDIDYRGSAGYGRDFRTGIYRWMGGKDLSDHVDGAEFLVENYGVDKERIGIYGGSYGGFITLMALFNESETFACGAALRAVTDWAHYNHGYTSNILNEPFNDSLAYVKSSPIYFAEGLEDPLLICHGMIDDNVQYQDVVRLAQRLIELEKDDWEMAVYPVERHSFTEPKSWNDEYKRIFKLFQDNLKK